MMIEDRIARLECLLGYICREHPEFCPHEYEWQSSKCINKEQDIWEEYYKCNLCEKLYSFQKYGVE